MILGDFEQNRKSKMFFFFGFDFLILVKSEQNRKSETFFFFFGFDFSELLQNLAYIQYIHYFRFRVYTLSQKRK